MGTCILKSASTYTQNIFVNAATSLNIKSVQTITGTSTSDAFNTLQDAITKAYELAAPYTLANINIYLKGNTAMLRQATDYYMPTRIDSKS